MTERPFQNSPGTDTRPTAPQTGRRKNGTLAAWLAVAMLATFLALLGRYFLAIPAPTEGQLAAPDQMAAGSGKWLPAQQQTMSSTIELNGTLASADVTVISAPFDGNIEQLQLTPGQTVAAGQALFKVVSLEMQSRRNDAFAALTRARLALDEVRTWANSAPMMQATQALERAVTNLARAQKRREQVAILLDKGIAASGELGDAELEVENATDQLANARAQYRQEQSKGSQAELLLATNNHESAKTLFQGLSARLQRADVTAPVKGVLVKVPSGKPLSNGLKVSQDEALVGIWNRHSYLVRSQIDQHDVAKVAIGQSAIASISAIGINLPGKVTYLAQESSDMQGQIAGRYEIEIRLEPNTPMPAGLRPGMSAGITLQTASVNNAVTVPLAALRKRTNAAGTTESLVLVKPVGSGKAAYRIVQTGLTSLDAVQIRSGLNPGEAVWVVLE